MPKSGAIHREHLLVERLRGSEAFVPRLSLVAECDGIVVGYALMSEVRIESDGNYEISLALAPVAVLPEFQRQGIGSALIREAHPARCGFWIPVRRRIGA